jgi:hypothetical protein
MKRNRIDSNAAQARMVQARVPEPPDHVNLREGDRPFWDSIVRARDYESWNAADLEQAANLARCKADIERVQMEINAEGDTIINARGTPILNPKHTLLETLSRRSVALSRMLHVHAEATVGESRHQTKRSSMQREAEDIRQMPPKHGVFDSLIAPPMQ